MVNFLSPAVRTFLEVPGRFAVVATMIASRPHQAVVWYELRDDTLLVNGRADRAWVKAARRDGWLSVTIADGYDYVIVSGPFTELADPEVGAADIAALARRYREDPGPFAGQARVSLLVRPQRVAAHGAPARD